MSTINKTILILGALAGLSCSNLMYAQEPATVHVRLALADNKATYRMGEPIKLILEFTADDSGYQVDKVPDRSEPGDTISISPDFGVYHWLDEYTGRNRYPRDFFSLAKLSTSPTRVELLLNDSIRFDRPGKYSVKVATRRVSSTSSPLGSYPSILLMTNEVNFEVQPMSDADEASEVKRLSELLDAAHGAQAEERVTADLSYLTGDPSAREKVRRFLNGEGRSGNYAQHITYGLFIARNRTLVLRLLEAALRDPGTPATTPLLFAVSRLRWLKEDGGIREKSTATVGLLSPLGDPGLMAIQDAYVAELAASLGSRVGKSQTTTAMTILMHLPKEPQTLGPILAEVRPLLLQQFDSLHPFDQEYLLRMYWEQLRDPSLTPSLKKLLGSTGVASKNIHDSALKRLMEIAPDEARTFVIAEIRDPNSLVDIEILGSLSDKSLPEVDEALLDQILRRSSLKTNVDSIYLKQKTSLAARYATSNIYGDLIQSYRSTVAKLPLDSRANLLAYFAKYNEQEALPLVEQTLADLQPGQDFNFLPELTHLYYSDGIDALLVKRLNMDEPQAASTAAYLLSLHGSAQDEKALESRLGLWRKEWGSRPSDAETNLQGTVERELILALLRGKSWRLSPERIKELHQSCITKMCRQSVPPQ
jgi:hypothetical protein